MFTDNALQGSASGTVVQRYNLSGAWVIQSPKAQQTGALWKLRIPLAEDSLCN